MSAIIANFEVVMLDGRNPSTSTAAANLNADRYSEVLPIERAFMGAVQLKFVAGAAGTLHFQVSQDFGVGDDEGLTRINSEHLVTNWVTVSTQAVGATDTGAVIQLSDIGSRWGRVKFSHSTGTGVISSFRANFKGY